MVGMELSRCGSRRGWMNDGDDGYSYIHYKI